MPLDGMHADRSCQLWRTLVPFSTLQLFIPGITYYRVKAARHHKQLYGRGVKVDDTRSPRVRVDDNQLDHFLTFITRSPFWFT